MINPACIEAASSEYKLGLTMESPTSDELVRLRREAKMNSLLATLFLSCTVDNDKVVLLGANTDAFDGYKAVLWEIISIDSLALSVTMAASVYSEKYGASESTTVHLKVTVLAANADGQPDLESDTNGTKSLERLSSLSNGVVSCMSNAVKQIM